MEVLGRDDMDEENNLKPNNVASILGDYSGVPIQQTSITSGNSGIRIQGLASRYTQILRDGMPLYAGLAGDFGILQVQPLDLQQIELIKKPASAKPESKKWYLSLLLTLYLFHFERQWKGGLLIWPWFGVFRGVELIKWQV